MIGDTVGILNTTGDPDDAGDTGPRMTVWTIDGEAAGNADGSWSGALRNNEDD